MKNYLIFLITALLLTSCVTENKHEKLKSKKEKTIDSLKLKIKELKSENEMLEFSLSQEKAKNLKEKESKKYGIEDAKKLVYDYFEFYKTDYVVKEAKLRKKAKNKFYVSLRTCMKDVICCEQNFCIDSEIYLLTIYYNGEYKMERQII